MLFVHVHVQPPPPHHHHQPQRIKTRWPRGSRTRNRNEYLSTVLPVRYQDWCWPAWLGWKGGDGSLELHRVRPFRLNFFFASKRIVSEQRSISHEIRLFTSSIRFFRLFSLQIFCNYSLWTLLHPRISSVNEGTQGQGVLNNRFVPTMRRTLISVIAPRLVYIV